jgi:VWFA-related protein
MMRSSVKTPNRHGARLAILILSLALAPSGLAQTPTATFKAEVNLVTVPVVVRDRGGRPVGNLTQQDFELSDNGRKQVITKFSVEKAAQPAEGQKPAGEANAAGFRATESTAPRFVALVFDDLNLHMGGMGDLGQSYLTLARDAARRYVAKLTPADQVSVCATSGQGSLDFTSDRAALEQALLKLRTTQDPTPPNLIPGVVFDPHGTQVEMQSRLSLQALQVASRRLAGLPGPRIMVFLSPGFSLPPEMVSQANRAIEVAISSGVVINVLNVRGLEARVPETQPGHGYYDAPARDLEAPLAQLAEGTGGTYIRDTNDYDGALRRLAAKPEYLYLLGFEPDDLKQDGRLHSLKVTLRDPRGLNLQARRGYLDPKPGTEVPDSASAAGFQPMIHGILDLTNPLEKELENVAASPTAPASGASVALPFFYRGPNVARVDMALDIPSVSFEPIQQGDKLRAELAILGLAYTPAGRIAARFSDKAHFEFATRQQFDEFARQPLHYEHQFDVAAGKYNLKVVYRWAKDSFGKVEAPLAVDPWDARQLGLSAIALSREVEPAPPSDGLDEALEEGPKPLVFRGVQIVVSGTGRLRQDGLAEAYLEVYEPLLKEKKPIQVELRLRLLDDPGGGQKWDSGSVNLSALSQAGNPVIPVALRLPVAGLPPGSYRAEFTVRDSSGATALREARFQLE